MSGLKLATAPAVEPLTVAEVRDYLHQDSDADDARLAFLISAVRLFLERRWSRRFITQTWDEVWDCFPAGALALTLAPVSSVTSVKYVDTAGVEQTVSATAYRADLVREPCRIAPIFGSFWPLAGLQPIGAVTVRYVAGYGATGSAVPADIRDAIHMLVAHRYENPLPVSVAEPGSAAGSHQLEWALGELDEQYRLHWPLLA